MEDKRVRRKPDRYTGVPADADGQAEAKFELDVDPNANLNYIWFSLQDLYHVGSLPFRPPLTPLAVWVAEMGVPMHPYLYSWARGAGVNTDEFTLTRAILLAEGRDVRLIGTSEDQNAYIAFVNGELESLIKEKDLEAIPEGISKAARLSIEAAMFRQYSLPPFQRRLSRVMDGSTRNDIGRIPESIRLEIPFHLFMHLLPSRASFQSGDNYLVQSGAGKVAPILSLVCEPHELDSMFAPTAAELAVDGTLHPRFGHEIRQRWYSNYRDSKTLQNDGVFSAMRTSVTRGTMRLLYSLRGGYLTVGGTFKHEWKAYDAAKDQAGLEALEFTSP
jgi:hypothetical protein